jgi:hypothetical protein
VKRRAWSVTAALAFSLACASPFEASTAPAAPLDQPVKLGMSQSRSFDAGRLELGIREVLEDSRCPADVVCIQAGRGRLAAWTRTESGRREIELRTDARPPQAVDGYTVEVTALEPYPYSNVRIDPRQYVATVIVRRR